MQILIDGRNKYHTLTVNNNTATQANRTASHRSGSKTVPRDPRPYCLMLRELRQTLTDFWATVCKTVRPMLSDRCLSCLSVCLFCL